MLENLIDQHGQSNVQSAMNNNMMGALTSQLGQAIQCAPGIPQFARDEMCQALQSVAQSCPQEPTPPGCQQDTDNSMSGLIDKIVNKVVDQIMQKLQGGGCENGGSIQDMVRQAIEDVVRENIGGGAEDSGCAANSGTATTDSSEDSSSTSTTSTNGARSIADDGDEETKKKCKGSGSWLVALAEAMGRVSANHLDKMLDAQADMEASSTPQEELDKMSKEDQQKQQKKDADAFTIAQSKFQAESKLFSMSTEAASTALKSIGDGLSSLARKQ